MILQDRAARAMGNKLYLRRAVPSDADILFQWANDEDVRKNAFSTGAISYEEHTAWFQALLHDPRQAQYILMEGDTPVGQARLMAENGVAEVSYSISAKHRRCGYGKEIIRLVKQKARDEYPGMRKLTARVKPFNIASLSCFMANGFEENYRFLEYDMESGRKQEENIPFVGNTGRGGGKSPLSDEQQECP